MALAIAAPCVNCWACEPLCPNRAIHEAKPHLRIDPRRCNECEGEYAEPQCASICPVECAILDSHGRPLNPPDSLTGIPPERLVAVRAGLDAGGAGT